MQSLATFFEDNKPLAYAAVVAAAIVLVFVVFVLYRLLFGRRLRAGTNGRARQPRLGIVDAYDLDRQRQLVLVRRDNVEHLIMIGGPTDVVVESSIVRAQSAAAPRDKDGTAPMVGGFAAAPALATAPAPAAAAILPPAGSRTEPPMAARNEPALVREDGAVGSRSEPSLGIATPMSSPIVERPAPDRAGQRPVAVPDPAAPAPGPGSNSGESAGQTTRSLPPRPPGLPPRPVPAGSPTPTQSGGSAPVDRPAVARPPLPPRPPIQRTPLPPRPSLASSLPPRPPRPPLPNRSETPRPEAGTTPPAGSEMAGSQAGAPTPQSAAPVEASRVARGPEPTPPQADASPPAPAPKNLEMLESLEEEMAKLLGRPAPRREG